MSTKGLKLIGFAKVSGITFRPGDEEKLQAHLDKLRPGDREGVITHLVNSGAAEGTQYEGDVIADGTLHAQAAGKAKDKEYGQGNAVAGTPEDLTGDDLEADEEVKAAKKTAKKR